jgi:hypothetical protein
MQKKQGVTWNRDVLPSQITWVITPSVRRRLNRRFENLAGQVVLTIMRQSSTKARVMRI